MQLSHLNAKDSWEGVPSSSTQKLTLSKEPLLVAIQLHHVHAAVHMLYVELLPALACMHFLDLHELVLYFLSASFEMMDSLVFFVNTLFLALLYLLIC